MNKLIKFVNHPLFKMIVEDRGIRVYKTPVDSRLGMPGLEKIVLKVTGHKPKLDEAYAFIARNRDTVKILTRDEIGTSLLEFHEQTAREMKRVFMDMTLI